MGLDYIVKSSKIYIDKLEESMTTKALPTTHFLSAHDNPNSKFPAILSKKPGFLNQLSLQQQRKTKREQHHKTVRENLDSNHHALLKKQKDYGNKTKQLENRMEEIRQKNLLKAKLAAHLRQEIMGKTHHNKENTDRREEAFKQNMYSIETGKLEKSVLLREMALGNKSDQSRASRGTKSVENIPIDPDESLSEINLKMDRAKELRLQHFLQSRQSKSKNHERQALNQKRNQTQESSTMSNNINSLIKTFSSFKSRMSELKSTEQQKILQQIKREKEKQELTTSKCNYLKEQHSNKLKGENDDLQQKMRSALATRTQATEQQRSYLINRNRSKLLNAQSHHSHSLSSGLFKRDSILKKCNEDYRIFKVFKSELNKTAFSNHLPSDK